MATSGWSWHSSLRRRARGDTFTTPSPAGSVPATRAAHRGPMRIALVTEHWFSRHPASDGTTTTVKAVADRLIDLGHDVRLVAPGPGLTRYRSSRVVRVNPLA